VSVDTTRNTQPPLHTGGDNAQETICMMIRKFNFSLCHRGHSLVLPFFSIEEATSNRTRQQQDNKTFLQHLFLHFAILP
jgi:hypothetical protein